MLPWFHRLKKACQFTSVDNVIVANMKNIGREYLGTNISQYLTEYHEIAVFLCPILNKLQMFSSEKRERIILETKTLMDELFPTALDVHSLSRRPGRSRSNTNSSISKTLSMFHNISDNENDDGPINEIDEYIDLRIQDIGTNILDWWYENKSRFPRLTKLACFVLSIPASSASVERAFSTAGYTAKNRPNLGPSTLDNLLLLKSSHDLM